MRCANAAGARDLAEPATTYAQVQASSTWQPRHIGCFPALVTVSYVFRERCNLC